MSSQVCIGKLSIVYSEQMFNSLIKPDNWKNRQDVKHDGNLKLTMPEVTFEFTGEGKDGEG